jgi:hypothetical protein
MIKQLTVVEQDYAYSEGLIKGWVDGVFEGVLKNAPDNVKKQVKENLDILIEGISSYREKYVSIQEDYDRLQSEYNRLMATSAQHLEFMAQQKQQLDEALIREQRAYQTDEEPKTMAILYDK